MAGHSDVHSRSRTLLCALDRLGLVQESLTIHVCGAHCAEEGNSVESINHIFEELFRGLDKRDVKHLRLLLVGPYAVNGRGHEQSCACVQLRFQKQ